MCAIMLTTEALRRHSEKGTPIWDGSDTQIVVFCPQGHLNPFPPKWQFCLCGFHFTELIKRYNIRYKRDV